MTDCPLYDATLSDVLARARHEADARVAAAEERVRAQLAGAAPPLVELAVVEAPGEDDGPVAPPVPAFADLLTSTHRLDAFFDALIGP